MKNPPNTPVHLKGQLLLADPSLRDGMFNKSVIFLTEHNDENGAYGLILNHPTDQTVGDLLQKKEFEELANIKVYIGGPVEQEQLTFAAFTKKKGKLVRLTNRISAQDAIIRSKQPGTLVRAFAGFSAWSAGQLEKEIKLNSWITAQPDDILLRNAHNKNLWAELLRVISPYHQILAESPDDIFVN